MKIFLDNVLNEIIFTSLERHTSRYDVLTFEQEDENCGSSSSSRSSSYFDDYERIKYEMEDGDVTHGVAKCRQQFYLAFFLSSII